MSPSQLLKLADGMIVKQKQRFQAAWTYEETMLYVGVLQVSLVICPSCTKLSNSGILCSWIWLAVQAQGKHQEALDHVKGSGGNALVIAAERGALEGQLMVRKSWL